MASQDPAIPARSGKKFPCPQCGARLDYNPASRGLRCPYCNYAQEINKEEDAEVLERDYKTYLIKISKNGTTQGIAGHTNECRCGGCGAVVILEDRVVTDRCPFCSTHLDTTCVKIEGLIDPESILPFNIELRLARDSFTKWLDELWFAPSELKKLANLGQLTGVYLPYWTYDTETYTYYSGERGDNYIDYETYTVTDSQGRTRTERRQVTRIHWYPASGEIEHFFDDVLVCGSHSLPVDLIRQLEPWDLPRLIPFKADYLSGFKTERYGIGLEEGLEVAKRLIEPEIIRLIRQDIGGDHQRIHNKKTRYTAITFKHTLLPVWVAVYRYRDRVFQILVNGRTGEVVGHRPWSFWKIASAIGIVLFVIGIIALIVQLTSR